MWHKDLFILWVTIKELGISTPHTKKPLNINRMLGWTYNDAFLLFFAHFNNFVENLFRVSLASVTFPYEPSLDVSFKTSEYSCKVQKSETSHLSSVALGTGPTLLPSWHWLATVLIKDEIRRMVNKTPVAFMKIIARSISLLNLNRTASTAKRQIRKEFCKVKWSYQWLLYKITTLNVFFCLHESSLPTNLFADLTNRKYKNRWALETLNVAGIF